MKKAKPFKPRIVSDNTFSDPEIVFSESEIVFSDSEIACFDSEVTLFYSKTVQKNPWKLFENTERSGTETEFVN